MRIGIIGKASQASRYETALRQRFIEPLNLTAETRQALIRENSTAALCALLQTKKLTGLIIATPPHVQLAVLMAVQNLDIPMILEKPLACSYSELKELRSLGKLRAPVFVNHPHLFDKRLGDFIHGFHSDPSRHCPDIHKLLIVEGGRGPFRTNVSAFFDWGIHAVVACLAIFGEMPLNVECESTDTNTQKDGRLWKMNMSFSDTRSASLLFGNGLTQKMRSVEGLDLHGKKVLSVRLADNLWGIRASASCLVDSFLTQLSSRGNISSYKPAYTDSVGKNSFELSVRGLELMMPHIPSSD